jgi:hypothetical protein
VQYQLFFLFLLTKRLDHIGICEKSLDNLPIRIWLRELFGTPIWTWKTKNIYPHIIWLMEHLCIWLENWNLLSNLGHTNLEMKDKKYLSAYHITYRAFMYLVRELEPFVKSRATMFVKAPFELRKVIGLMLYWFANGVSANIIVDRFNVGASTMCSMLILLSML